MTNNSFWISLADLTVEINSKYDRLRSFCEEYIVTKDEKAEIAVSVTDDEIDSEMSLCGDLHSRAYCENLCIYRAIAERLPEYNRFVLHGAALSTFGKGYIFAAPSGVGKSTHVRLWRECFGDNVKIINGDKPIIRRAKDGSPM